MPGINKPGIGENHKKRNIMYDYRVLHSHHCNEEILSVRQLTSHRRVDAVLKFNIRRFVIFFRVLACRTFGWRFVAGV